MKTKSMISIILACLFNFVFSNSVNAKTSTGLNLTPGFPAVIAPSGQIDLEYTAPLNANVTGVLLGREYLGSGVWGVYDESAIHVGSLTIGVGDFFLTAELDKNGNLVGTGSYSLFGTVDLFATAGNDFVGLVLGADLTDFGYINDDPLLGDVFEFVATNFTGFMCDFFGCTVQEGAVFRSGTNFSSFDGKFCCGSGADWKAFTDGHMWVPIPAAVWLFGSGLAGLFGYSYRRGNDVLKPRIISS